MKTLLISLAAAAGLLSLTAAEPAAAHAHHHAPAPVESKHHHGAHKAPAHHAHGHHVVARHHAKPARHKTVGRRAKAGRQKAAPPAHQHHWHVHH